MTIITRFRGKLNARAYASTRSFQTTVGSAIHARKMAEKGGVLPIEAAATVLQSGGGSSSRESSPDDDDLCSTRQQEQSMDSLILSGESSDDILIDDMLEDEEIVGSGGEDPEAMTMGTEGSDDQSSGMISTIGLGRSAKAGGVPHNSTIGGQQEEEVVEGEEIVGAEQKQQQKRNKKKRRITTTRERKISISSSRVKVFMNCVSDLFCQTKPTFFTLASCAARQQSAVCLSCIIDYIVIRES